MTKENNILSDAEKVLRRHRIPKPKKPKWICREHWLELSEETRYLWNRVQQLEKLVYEAYLEALRHEDWRRALELVLASIGKPILPSVSHVLYPKDVCRKNEAEFIAKAKEWIAEAEGLLGSGC